MRHTAGLTLIEVLLSAVIFAVAVVTLLLIQTNVIRRGMDADTLRRLSMAATSQMVLVRDEQRSTGSGRCDAPFDGFGYTFTREPDTWEAPSDDSTLEDVATEIDLIRLTLTVTAKDGRTVTLVTHVSPPDSEEEE